MASSTLPPIEITEETKSYPRSLLDGEDIRRITERTACVFSKLPPEILTSIFRECAERIYLPICYPCSTVTMPWVLGQVCSSWKKFSENEPELWSSLTLSYTLVRDKVAFNQRVQETIIPRAKLEPISLTCSGRNYVESIVGPNFGGVIPMLVMPNLARFRHLSLSLDATALEPLISSSPILLKLLESVEIVYDRPFYGGPHNTMFEKRSITAFGFTPNLRKVRLQCRPYYRFVGENPVSLPWGQLTELSIDGGLPYSTVVTFLHSCVQLIRCHLFIEEEAVPCSNITLPRLQSISLDFNSSDSASSLLEILILPVLKDFRLCVDSFNPIYLQEILLAFLSRSECPLEYFELGYPYRNPIRDISVLLERMPRLRKLYLPILAPLTTPVIQRMIDGQLVPHLEAMHCSIPSLPMTLNLLEVRKSGRSPGAHESYRGIKCALIWGFDLQSKCVCGD
ncbi:hypothetical protein BDZ94DRAFT_1322749 [Collybia nuda]|uniref:F-box domain-containing protein n=1 Tax=Collybia nuda TaxID=64659 RepID=A0A9P6CIT4_9AGAR|nr:hypothetical protein BDZ94DRAFT_1322749 [Collybia nuda]